VALDQERHPLRNLTVQRIGHPVRRREVVLRLVEVQARQQRGDVDFVASLPFLGFGETVGAVVGDGLLLGGIDGGAAELIETGGERIDRVGSGGPPGTHDQ
jgi:hypothetical protein